MSARIPTAARTLLPWLGLPLLVCCLVSSAWGEDAAVPGFIAAPPPDVPAEPHDGSGTDSLLDLDIEQLGEVDVVVPSFDVEVTSVTKRQSTVGKSPAAVFVITPEMIRRSGATSIPELLRLVPGLDVARTDMNKWAITSRGFNSRFANKLLVMIDGRSVYNPLFAGVYWEAQDYVLEDIARIEVIRGPGAALWGENAVNGVINIITKSAAETQGAFVSSTVGDVDEAINSVRYGERLGNGAYLRVYGKQSERDDGVLDTGAHDDWRFGQTGFRIDWPLDCCGHDLLTLQGDVYSGTFGGSGRVATPAFPFSRPFVEDARMTGGNLLGRWSRTTETGEFYFQAYYDQIGRDEELARLTVDTYDAEFQHRFSPIDRHALTWGVNVRHVQDDIETNDPFVFQFEPGEDEYTRYSLFLQDEIAIVRDRVVLFAGSKFSYNEFTEFEIQPGVRALWMIDPRQAVWAAVSRAVRLPSRVEEDINVVLLAPAATVFTSFSGSSDLEAEELTAYEIGYRAQPNDRVSWDVATFYNVYNDLIDIRLNSVRLGLPPALVFQYVNAVDAESYGCEFNWAYHATDHWRLQGWYSFLELHTHGRNASEPDGGSVPRHQAFLMSSWDLSPRVEFDLIGRYVDNVPVLNVRQYVSLDARLGYRANDCWEFAVVGQNLLDRQHREFREDFLSQSTEVPRGVYFQAVWRH